MKRLAPTALATLATALSAAASPTDPLPPATPPMSAWLCDDGSGTVLADSYGFSPGELKNGMGNSSWSGATPFAYAGNRALVFDGVDDHVELSLGGIATGRTNVSVSAWFWWDDDGAHKEYAIWGERDECQYNVFAVTVERRTAVPNGLAFADFVRTPAGVCGNGGWWRASSSGVPSSAAWHHVAAVLDASDGMSIYLDGVLAGTSSNTTPYYGGHGRTTIGDIHTAAYDGYWNGALDEIALFDYALSPEEVLWLAQHSLSELSQPVVYCTAGTTTNGCNASMSASGTPSVAASSGFVLSCAGVEGQRTGILFYGTSGPKAASWGPGSTSYLCVKSPVQRTSAASSGGTDGACDGAFVLDFLDYLATHPGAVGQPMAAGTVVNAQVWFRDPPAAGTTNLSNAIQWKMVP